MSRRRVGRDDDYLVVSLSFPTINQFLGILTLGWDDARKMNVKVGGGLIVRIRSAEYKVTTEEQENTKRQIEHNPALARLHWTRMQARVTEMAERYSAPRPFTKVGYKPFNYYVTAFHWTDDGVEAALLPIYKDTVVSGEISVGDLVILEVTTPLH